ncbi:hypothetical protein COY95_04685, partial [Candidatus Woesearchaeota archaeon CG_4_10_14_0_8_um_filter_47_5]
MIDKGILDDKKKITAQDEDNMLASVDSIPEQAEQAWSETQAIEFPGHYRSFNKVVACGMGGSHLGTDIIKALFKRQLTAPLLIFSHYEPPHYVDASTLVLLSSYSGNTEETLAFGDSVKTKTKKIMGICSGGKLAGLLKEQGYPVYDFDPKHNPCGQPRIGLGYAIVGQIGMFSKLGLFTMDTSEVRKTLTQSKSLKKQWSLEQKTQHNQAKQYAYSLHEKIIVFVSAEFLFGNAHTARNQLHENAKQFGDMFEIPELNHHLLEGLRFP